MKTKTNFRDILAIIAIAAVTISALFAFQGVVLDTYANSLTSNVNANVVVGSACEISLSPAAISFGTLNPGTDTNTNVVVTDTNNGNLNSYMWVYGGNWLLGSNFGFGVSNTLWDASSQTGYLGAALSTTPANTAELVGFGPSNSNSIYFGLGIPNGQGAGTYNQIITLLNVC